MVTVILRHTKKVQRSQRPVCCDPAGEIKHKFIWVLLSSVHKKAGATLIVVVQCARQTLDYVQTLARELLPSATGVCTFINGVMLNQMWRGTPVIPAPWRQDDQELSQSELHSDLQAWVH